MEAGGLGRLVMGERTAFMRHLPGQRCPCARGCRRRSSGNTGFTLIELMVTMGIIAVLLGLTLTVVARARQSARSTACLANLHHIGQGFVAYVMQSGGSYPDPLSAGQRWEDVLKSLVPGAGTFRCDADDELFPAFSSSYDWRDTGNSLTTLAGRRATEVKRQGAVLAFESLPGWHARKKMNAVRVDLSAETMDEQQCLLDLTLRIDILDASVSLPQACVPLQDQDLVTGG
jgi:prepilin-type N-terminal cleavage/methylation domain-containing protein